MRHLVSIRRLSRVLRLFCLFAAFAIPLLTAFYWLEDGTEVFPLPGDKWFFQFVTIPSITLHTLTPTAKILGFLTDLIPCTFFVITMSLLMKLFRLYENSQFFTLQNTRCIRQIALILFLSPLVHPFYVALHSSVLSIPQNLIFFGPHEIKTLFLSAALFLASYILEIARHLHEEYSATI